MVKVRWKGVGVLHAAVKANSWHCSHEESNANLSVFTLLQQRSLSTHSQFEMHIFFFLKKEKESIFSLLNPPP